MAAYELRKAGFDCTVLEARQRPGGRNWSVRGGDKVEFTDGTAQQCAFDQGLYLNAGPGRIPSIHRTLLGYCRELGVEMEVEINSTRSALVQNDHMFDKRPIEQRQAINDMRGHVAELLAKAVRQGALDQEITARDKERMVAFLRGFGDLGADYRYTGSTRAGVSRFAGAADAEDEGRPPLPLGALLDAGFWQGLLLEERLDMQAVMLQPIGGMDRIAFAFARRLGNVVKYGCPVTEIRKTAAGVRVVYAEGEGRRTRAVEASYCVCAVPPMLLAATATTCLRASRPPSRRCRSRRPTRSRGSRAGSGSRRTTSTAGSPGSRTARSASRQAPCSPTCGIRAIACCRTRAC